MAIKKKNSKSSAPTKTAPAHASSKSAGSKKESTKVQAKAAGKSAKSEHKTDAKTPEKRVRTLNIPKRPMMDRTFFAKTGETPEKWRLIDASGATLGRLSTVIAHTLMGKDKPSYTRHADTGDHVIVVNAEKVRLTGSKETDKKYYSHSHYPGGIKEQTAEEVRSKHPERLVQLAVYRMLPKGHMGRRWFKKLRVFAGPSHPHTSQKPEVLKLSESLRN